jgi:hypothetical protein
VIAAGRGDDDIDQLIKTGSKGSRATDWMRLVVDTNVFASATLNANSLPFTVVWIGHHGGLRRSSRPSRRFLAVRNGLTLRQ